MPPTDVVRALERLRAAADQAHGGFPTTTWTRVQGPGPDTLELGGGGGFAGLTFEPGKDLTLRCALDTPAEAHGVRLEGDALEGTLFSLYPCEIRLNGETVFRDDAPAPVAAGPALFTLAPALGTSGADLLEITVRIPDNQTTAWFNLRLTTPGLRARFEALDVAWAQLALSDAVAASNEERAAVGAAAAGLPDPLPTEAVALTAALAALAGALSPLDARVRALPVHLVGHSHIDMNWLWTWPDTVEVIRRDARSVLGLMDEFPELTFSHSQPATYEVLRECEPAMFQRILAHIRAGRWEPLTATWVEGDANMASGEAMARQMLEGVTYSREALGYTPRVFHAPDTFGHAGNLPQLAAQAGARFYYHHRANPGHENQWPAYWWEGQDGTRILGLSTPSYNGEIHARDLAAAALAALRHGLPAGLHFHGIGDHGGGPSRQNLRALRRLQAMPLMPAARCSTVAAYAGALLEAGAALPVHRGESGTIFEGCYTTHADTKRYNRQGENLLCTADTLAALAGLDRTAELTPAWRGVLFNQFHDILDGSAIHESYVKNREDFEGARAAAEAVTRQALSALEAGLEPGAIAVTNPLGWDREDWVEVAGVEGIGAVWLRGEHGHRVLGQYTAAGLGFVARVPAYATMAYRVEGPAGADGALSVVEAHAPAAGGAAAPGDPNAPYLRVETPAFRVHVRRDCGVLVGLLDRRAGRELVGFGMRRASDYVDSARPDLALNVLQVTDEHPHGMTAWQLNEVHTEHSLLRGASTTVVESGPARVVLEVAHAVRSSTIRQRISFYRDLARVDFLADVDWQEVGGPEAGVPGLKAAFTARLETCEAWFETPFAAVRRPADGQEVPALRWADVGGPDYGIAVLNDGKYGHDVLGCRLRVTLLRSAYEPDAISDVGRHAIRYALLPHVGDWRDAGVARAGAAFNQPLLARAAEPRPRANAGPRPLVSDGSVLASCLKAARDGSGTAVRLYESAGRAATVRLSGLPADAPIWETDVAEVSRVPVEAVGDDLTLAFRPWQVRTLIVGETR